MKGTALKPSQHIRSTRNTARTARTALAAVVLLGTTLALSACGTQQAGAAAIVDGTTISDKDVQAAALQLRTLAQSQTTFTPRIVLRSLILDPYVQAEFKRISRTVTDAEARDALAQAAKAANAATVADPSPATISFVKTQLAIQALSPASKATILTQLAKAEIIVNPRYGTFDVTQAVLLPTSPNWIKASASPVAK